MDSHITIPPEAFTAAELAYTEALSNGEDPLRAACLAMLKNWSGAHEARSNRLDSQVLILPLTQEKTNAEG